MKATEDDKSYEYECRVKEVIHKLRGKKHTHSDKKIIVTQFASVNEFLINGYINNTIDIDSARAPAHYVLHTIERAVQAALLRGLVADDTWARP